MNIATLQIWRQGIRVLWNESQLHEESLSKIHTRRAGPLAELTFQGSADSLISPHSLGALALIGEPMFVLPYIFDKIAVVSLQTSIW
jgi:hypothetical protein